MHFLFQIIILTLSFEGETPGSGPSMVPASRARRVDGCRNRDKDPAWAFTFAF
jgi:hypothetical protein